MTMTNAEAAETIRTSFTDQTIEISQWRRALRVAISALEATGEPEGYYFPRSQTYVPAAEFKFEGVTPASDGVALYLHPAPSVPAWQPPPDKWVRDYAKKHCSVKSGDHWKSDAWNLNCAFRAWTNMLAAAPEVKP